MDETHVSLLLPEEVVQLAPVQLLHRPVGPLYVEEAILFVIGDEAADCPRDDGLADRGEEEVVGTGEGADSVLALRSRVGSCRLPVGVRLPLELHVWCGDGVVG